MKTLRINARPVNAIGITESFDLDWPERPTKQDMLKVYDSYEHISSPRLVTWNDDGTLNFQSYPEFFNLA